MKNDTTRLLLLALFAFGVLALIPITILLANKTPDRGGAAHLHPTSVTLPNGRKITCIIVTEKESTSPSGVSCDWP